MSRYVLFIAYESSEWDAASAEVRESYYRDHEAFSAFVAAHGTEHASGALADAERATTVRHRGGTRDGEIVVTEGPFAETAEQLGGYYDVELPDLDHAVRAAALLPATYSVEIRPTISIG
ncbi:YciI family protein [Nocardioides sp. zg-1228]|uniref:YciI family protein n=1 Tax=Nocardioides sp. zg-1228 TaxID=2763008 RepID=UPI0016432438|nr:YciI family protein [Nocardioides sp. zg-1228]MBC2934386.1 hypothetical protein [Nocardioides sp. zg-1228]QSF59157.1 transcription initiation protein [Nocardioides sp. zg-1228]